jgi:hypothetical protein
MSRGMLVWARPAPCASAVRPAREVLWLGPLVLRQHVGAAALDDLYQALITQDPHGLAYCLPRKPVLLHERRLGWNGTAGHQLARRDPGTEDRS